VAASSQVAAGFAPVTRSVTGVTTSSRVWSVTVEGRPVAGVATYVVSPEAAKSEIFRDQFLVQLLNTLAKDARVTFVRMNGKPVAISKGKTSIAGWFRGSHAVVVLREASSPALESLVASLINTA
jgi:hypothetical protein